MNLLYFRRSGHDQTTDNASLQDIFEEAVQGVSRLDARDRFLSVNPAYAEAFGYLPEDMVAMPWQSTLHPEDIPLAEQAQRTMRRIGRADVSVRLLTRNGIVFQRQLVLVRGLVAASGVVSYYCLMKNTRSAADQGVQEDRRSDNHEAVLSEVFAGSPDVMMIMRIADGRLVAVNRAFTRVLGYARDEALADDGIDLFENPDDWTLIIEGLQDNGVCTGLELPLRSKQGRVLPMAVSASVITRSGSACILLIARDLTPQLEIESALREQTRRYESLVDDLNVVVWKLSVERFQFTFVNEAAEQLSGYPPSAWYEPGFWLDIVHPDDKDQAREYCLEATRQGRDHEFEYRIITADGRNVWVQDIVHVITDDNGEAVELQGVLIDISTRKRAEFELRNSKMLFNEAVNASPDGIAITRLSDSMLIELNDGMLQATGYSRDDVIGRPAVDLFWADPDERSRFVEQLDATGRCANLMTTVRRKDGATYPVLMSGSVIDFAGTRCAFTIIRDISELAAAHREMQQSEQQLRLITDTVPVLISYVDRDLVYRFVNAAFAREFGFSSRTVVGVSMHELLSTSVMQSLQTHIEQAFAGNTVKFDYRYRQGGEGGGERIFATTYVPDIRDAEVTGLYVVSNDISKLKQGEQELQQTNRVLRMLSECNNAVLKIRDENALLLEICNILVELGGYRLAWVGYPPESPGRMVRPVVSAGDTSARVSRFLARAGGTAGAGPALDAIATGERQVIRDLDAREDEAHRGLASCVALALKNGGEPLAVLMVYSADTGAFDGAELSMLERLVENLTFGIYSIRESRKRRNAEQILELENYAFQLIAAGEPLPRLLESIVTRLESYIASAMCSVLLLDEQGEHLLHGAAPSLPAAYTESIDGIRIGPQAGSCGTAVFRNETVLVADTNSDPLWTGFRDLARTHSLRACHSTPVRAADGRVLGAFAIYFRETRRLAAEELLLIEHIAHILGGAIERYQDQKALRDSEERFALAMAGTNDGIFDIKVDTGEYYFSPRWKAMLGYGPDELENSQATFDSLLHPQDAERVRSARQEFLAGRIDQLKIEYRLRHKDGHYVDVLSRASGIKDDQTGAYVRIVGTHLDMTERKRTQAQIRDRENQLRTLYDDSPAMFFTLDTEGRILSVNRFGADHLGYFVNELVGQSVFDIAHFSDHATVQETIAACQSDPNGVYRCEFRKKHKKGDLIWVREAFRLIVDDTGAGKILVTCEDISEARILSEQLEYQAKHDALTGLINRSEFERRLRRILNEDNHGAGHALCYLDLDQFKIINDSCGHLAGDELLRRVSDMLSTVVRRRDTLARLGGDEFAVLLEHCPLSQAERVAGDLLRAIDDFRFIWEGKRFALGASIGLVPIRNDSGTVTDVLRAADAACYAAKDGGRNRVHVFHTDDADLSRRKGEMQWVAEINSALEEDRLCLAIQPIAALDKAPLPKAGDHYEVLLRMRNRSGEIVPPGAFLPAAERYNLSTRLDRWVISKLFAWFRERPDRLHALWLCSINLSGHSLADQDFLEYLIQQIDAYEIPARKLCFEITETAAIANLGDAIKFMERLKANGCYFALDDFGTGLSSFNYLKNLPVDFLKIDGTFVRDIYRDPIDFAMVRSINEIGQVMGKLTIAEFVENRDILDVLEGIGINYAQGYAIGMPTLLTSDQVTAGDRI